MVYKNILYILITIIIISLPINATTYNSDNDFPYSLTADDGISYDSKAGIMQAEKNARFQRGDVSLEANKITVYYTESLIRAEGNLLFEVGDQVYRGEMLEYNYSAMTGYIEDINTEIQEINISGEKINLTEVGNYIFSDLEFTTCIYPDPHYSIKADKITVDQNNRLVAENVWFYFEGAHIFYLPTYTIYYNQDEGQYSELIPMPQLGYNPVSGFNLKLNYPYESGNFSGRLEADISQYRDKSLMINNRYQLNESLGVVNDYINLYEYNNNDIDKTHKIALALDYQNYGLELKTGLDYSFLLDRISYNTDVEYKKNNYSFKYYSSIDDNGELQKNNYSLSYDNEYSASLTHRQGYKVDYLPYFQFATPTYRVYDMKIKTAMAIGKVENEDIKINKGFLNFDVNKNIFSNKNISLDLDSRIESNIYNIFADISRVEKYNIYEIGLNSNYKYRISEASNFDIALSYKLNVVDGNLLIPNDKKDVKRLLNTSISFNKKNKEQQSFWEIKLASGYEFLERELEELEVRYTKGFDCYDYYISADFINKGIGAGISF